VISAMTKQARTSAFHSSWLSVHDGQVCIGHVLNRGKSGVEAFNVDDKSLGLFSTQKEAMAALSAAAS
jgi:hypothetical protein